MLVTISWHEQEMALDQLGAIPTVLTTLAGKHLRGQPQGIRGYGNLQGEGTRKLSKVPTA